MTEPRLRPEEVLSEFEGVELGDGRLERRLMLVVEQLSASPAASFPHVMKSEADREALYRFLGNEKVTLEGLLSAHIRETQQRALAAGEVRIAHDTTSLIYKGDREGLGPVKGGGLGFFAHFALAVSADEERNALGILGVRTHAHTRTEERRGMTHSQQVMYSRRLPREEKVSSRWEKLATTVSEGLPHGVQAVHVMDQEADDFVLLSHLVEHRFRFVVRGSGARITAAAGESISKVLDTCSGRLFRTVRLNRRPDVKARRRGHPQRDERDAELSIRWSPVVLPKPPCGQTENQQLELNVVHVYEPNPPENEHGVEWFLLTTDVVDTLEDATRVVDHYRARWVIEEFFKALKTGCAIEKRQLTNYDALTRSLGLLTPIAWRLLVLRQLANNPEPKPASVLFREDDLRLIRVLLSERRKDHRLPDNPTVRDVMLAIAAIGGHIKNNGDPGWLVLGRGFQTYVDAEVIWRAARCDQS